MLGCRYERSQVCSKLSSKSQRMHQLFGGLAGLAAQSRTLRIIS